MDVGAVKAPTEVRAAPQEELTDRGFQMKAPLQIKVLGELVGRFN
jgi:hypothetical protein